MRARLMLLGSFAVAALASTAVLADGPRLTLTSSELANDGYLPASATCDEEGRSPALAWNAVDGAKSFVLVVDDPDVESEPFVHWLLFDIAKDTTSIAHGGTAGISGTNSAKQLEWAPPCPPKGEGPHHYRFHLYALDVERLGAMAGSPRTAVVSAMKSHIVQEALLVGTYERR
jgi:Raf kinase inhibitor-like YbhB/YbcL family protein